MTQTIEYVVKVNATQAQAAVADVEKRFGGVDTVVARVDKSIIALERDMKDLNAAIAAGGPNVEHYRKELDSLTGTIGGGGGGGGKRNLGMAALETSRAVEDLQYGLAGVVNNIPSLVMAIGGGAGLTAAISLGAVAANQLYKNSKDLFDEFGRGEKDTKELLAYVNELATSFSTGLASSLEKTKGLVEDMRKELRLFGLERGEAAVAEAEFEYIKSLNRMENNKALADDRKERIRGLQEEATAMEKHAGSRLRMGSNGRLVGVANQEQYNELLDRIDLEKALLKLNGEKASQAQKAAQTQMDEIKQLAEMNAELELRLKWKKQEDEANQNAKKSAEQLAKTRYEMHVAVLDEEEEQLRAVREARKKDAKKAKEDAADFENEIRNEIAKHAQKNNAAADKIEEKRRKELERAEQLHLTRLEQLEGDSLAARMAFHTIAFDQKMENLDKLKAHEFKNLKDTAKQWESIYKDIGQLVQGSTSTLINVSQDYFKAKIEGAEHAEELAAAAFLSGVGEQLVGLGTKNIFEGASLLAMSFGVDPRGYAMLGIGTAAIAAGVGMGAGSAAISHQAAGGTAFKPLEDKKAAKDRGASPRSGSGGGGGSGGLVVNVSYGAGGPLPEDIAREIDKVVKSNDRRRGAA